MVKTLPANAGDTGSIPDREDPLEEGMAIHDGILVLEMPWTGEPGGLQSTGSQRVRHDLATKQPQLKKSLRQVDIRLWQTLFKTVFFFFFFLPCSCPLTFLVVSGGLNKACYVVLCFFHLIISQRCFPLCQIGSPVIVLSCYVTSLWFPRSGLKPILVTGKP